MMRKTLFVISFLFVFSQTVVQACDVCGAGAGMGIGLMTNYRNNFLRFGFINSGYNLIGQNQNSISDAFQKYDLSLSYKLRRKVRLTMSIPYGINIRKDDQFIDPLTLKGFGDASIGANYIIANLPCFNKGALYWEAGAGLIVPTGIYDSKLHDKNLPENFNLGKGNYAISLQSNFVLSISSYGFTASNTFIYNTKSTGGYQFGLNNSTQFNAFKELEIKKLKIIPSLGLAHEYASEDQYSNGREVHGTGGQGLFLSSTININYNNFLTGLSYSIPLVEKYSNGEVEAEGRLNAQLTYIF